jgi:putative peptide zinc metalloprotease protein
VRTDLGGLYFNAIVAVAVTAVWWATGRDAILLIVATQILQMVRQLTPLVRFDGYHVLADVTGVPDLFHRIRPTLIGVLPWRWGDPEGRLLKPWARAVVTLWVLAVVPLLLFTFTMLALAMPRVLATAWAKLGTENDVLAEAWRSGDPVQVSASVLVMGAVALPVVGTAYVVVRMLRRLITSVWRSTSGRPARRGLAGLVGVLMVAGLVYAWWPHGSTYRPIRPDERGTLVDAFRAAPLIDEPPARALEVGSTGTTQAVWDTTEPLPTKDAPQLAMVLIPRGDAATADPAGETETTGWVFPFDKPLAPGPGDIQALAVNTTDGTVVYDTAFALVWVDGQPAENSNEAYAFASCTSCAAVAVSFQVVLVVDDEGVSAPRNLAGALTSDCVNCLTYALAKQVFITLDGPLSKDAMAELDTLWSQIAEYGASVGAGKVPLEEIEAQLDDYEQQIYAVIEKDQPGTIPTASPSASMSGSASASASTGPSGSPSGSAIPSAGPSPEASGSSTPSPSAEATSSAPSLSPSASPSSSSGPTGSASPASSPSEAPSPVG